MFMDFFSLAGLKEEGFSLLSSPIDVNQTNAAAATAGLLQILPESISSAEFGYVGKFCQNASFEI